MEISTSHSESDYKALDDRGFLSFIVGKGVKLQAVDGQLRVTAAPGVLDDSLRDQLRHRKAALVALIEHESDAVGDLRRTDLGVRARRIGLAGQWTSQLPFWKEQLDGMPLHLELPFMRKLEVAASRAIERTLIALPSDFVTTLRSVAENHGVSAETVLLAGLALIIHRYTDKEDFCIGLPLMRKQRRRDAVVEEVIDNLVCVRCKPTSGMTFQNLVAAVHGTVSEAYAHADIPFSRLRGILPLQQGPNVHPLFQVFLGADLSGPPNVVVPEGGDSGEVDYDLAIYPDAHLQQVSFTYRAALCSRESIELFAECLIAVLQHAFESPDVPIRSLSILSPVRREQMLLGWNRTAMELPRQAAVHQLFEQAVAKGGDSVALIVGDERVTYADLNVRANQIARFLLAKDLSVGAVIGICMRRSADMVASMLAVLKAGYAYLPLDPVYPAQRLEAMLTDSRAELVLADAEVREPLMINERQITRIDMDEQDIRRMLSSNPDVAVRSNDLAYVIYTSGSTGRPKGVAIEHHSAVSFLTWGGQTYQAEDLERVFAATSICFDLSIFEIFLPLSLGGTVVLAKDFLELPRMPEARPTLLNTVPSAMSSFLASGAIPSSVRAINLAGEFLSEALVDRMQQQAPGARIYDLYGPTETTTYSTFTLRKEGMRASIGRPLANTGVYLVDKNLQPVPPEVPGQILIGGEGVARGYLYRPELTAERFVTPASLPEAGRVYMTGDQGRYRLDGEIEYLGRLDSQVKIRGFRVEPGEIENTLQQHPRIREAAVVVYQDDALGASLAAFVTIASGPVHKDELVAYQQKFLPAYMVVNNLTLVDDLPTTLNGKIDRLALRNRLQARPETQQRPGPTPVSELQQDIRTIWEKNFKRRPIGIDDDFFALGGHSLLAFQIFNEIERSMKISMMLSVLFKAPTIRLLAEEIEQKEYVRKRYARKT